MSRREPAAPWNRPFDPTTRDEGLFRSLGARSIVGVVTAADLHGTSGEALARPHHRRWWFVAVAVIVVALVGGVAGFRVWLTQEPSPVSVGDAALPRKLTAALRIGRRTNERMLARRALADILSAV